jgi:transcriptional regulator with XRE-family HTH domain
MSKRKSPIGEIQSPNRDLKVKSFAFEELGARLRSAAQDRGLTQRTLAQNIDIPTSTIGRYWHGQRLLPVDLLFRVADCLAVDPRWLATGESQSGGVLTSDEYELLIRFRGLSMLQRDHLLQSAGLLGNASTMVSSDKDPPLTSLHSPRVDYRVKPRGS